MRLFTYGTLLFPEVLEVLLGRVPDRSPAVAPGWRVAALPGRVYPGLVPGVGHHAQGQVIRGLDPAETAVLRAYEGEDYLLTGIVLADGSSCPAYVWRRAVLAADWTTDRLTAGQLDDFLRRCRRWRCGYQPR